MQIKEEMHKNLVKKPKRIRTFDDLLSRVSEVHIVPAVQLPKPVSGDYSKNTLCSNEFTPFEESCGLIRNSQKRMLEDSTPGWTAEYDDLNSGKRKFYFYI